MPNKIPHIHINHSLSLTHTHVHAVKMPVLSQALHSCPVHGSATGTVRLSGCRSPVFHQRELLPPVGEVAEGVRTGEVRGGRSRLQREDVVHHLTQTDITEARR